MAEEFVNGVRVKQHYAEMTPLDRAIDAYTKQAERYFDARNRLENAPEDVREKRKKEFESIKAGLEAQRMNAFTMADLQSQLDQYRDNVRKADINTLENEKHHPTEMLERFMRAAGVPKPDDNCTAHHIVPGKGRLRVNYFTRVHLHINYIGINDPDNGVYLPEKKRYTPHWHMPDSLGHKEYHTEGYERFINRRLVLMRTESTIRMELNLIGKMLQDNNLPPEARKK
ncbi:AHH domain-containing protein [Aliikangiella coralliicola]|uniref:Uncharacterized protein n=1 Tax=Aliikangiella coralliicola TaxID=2592383 RepID=A0A545UD21_9GAMM|nr:AHH domain-containing protein [Aliikangiella coralliicola]TQV87366.1 hypothetical protein FLL46_13035 [Aliikangiella coralliicola]